MKQIASVSFLFLLLFFHPFQPMLPAQAPQSPGDFPIGIGDLIAINVLGVADFTCEVRVSAGGTIRLPFLGEVKAAGLLPAQLEARLASLLNPDYVKDPQVSVVVKEPRSRMFSVFGAVLKPGQYPMTEQGTTLISAIGAAGGLNYTTTGDKAVIQRAGAVSKGDGPAAAQAADGDPPKAEAGMKIEVNLKKLMLDGDQSLDIQILPGDVISIPEREASLFFVIGDVPRPGSFEFPKMKTMKLSLALAQAGGPTKTSRLSASMLIRQHPDGSADRMAVNIDKILKGKERDIDLQPNDLLYVPGSVAKNFGWAMLGYLPSALTWRIIGF